MIFCKTKIIPHSFFNLTIFHPCQKNLKVPTNPICFEDLWKKSYPCVSVLLPKLVKAVSVTCHMSHVCRVCYKTFRNRIWRLTMKVCRATFDRTLKKFCPVMNVLCCLLVWTFWNCQKLHKKKWCGFVLAF